MSHNRRSDSVEGLGARERELVNAVFALGNRASAEEIRQRLRNPPTYSTVRVMLTRLEKKGYLRHVEEGSRYVYSATFSRTTAAKRALQHHVRTFFNGSLAQMVTALVREGSWTPDELRQLKAELERASKEDK
jgi:BlaI family penicillinase repressor